MLIFYSRRARTTQHDRYTTRYYNYIKYIRICGLKWKLTETIFPLPLKTEKKKIKLKQSKYWYIIIFEKKSMRYSRFYIFNEVMGKYTIVCSRLIDSRVISLFNRHVCLFCNDDVPFFISSLLNVKWITAVKMDNKGSKDPIIFNESIRST